MNRNEKIIELFESGFGLRVIGEKFKITRERVRQIVSPGITFKKPLFSQQEYLVSLEKMSFKQLQDEITKLSEKNREGLIVEKRCVLVRFLKDNKLMSYSGIARALQRDHTTIMHLYKKYEKTTIN